VLFNCVAPRKKRIIFFDDFFFTRAHLLNEWRQFTLANSHSTSTICYTSMFDSKPHRLGGTNDIFGRRFAIDKNMPPTVLRFDDACHHTLPGYLTLRTLNDSFDHYMSSGLVILKPSNDEDMSIAAKDMLECFRKWLTTEGDDDIPLYDAATKTRYTKKQCYFVENSEYMMIPRAIALSIFGPSIWLPRGKRSLFGNANNTTQRAALLSPHTFRPHTPCNRWQYAHCHNAASDGLADPIDVNPSFSYVWSRILAAQEEQQEASIAKAKPKKRSATGEVLPKKTAAPKGRQRMDHVNPSNPSNDHLPRPLTKIPLLLPSSDNVVSTLPSSVFTPFDPSVTPNHYYTNPLQLKGRIRKSKQWSDELNDYVVDFDQLSVIAAIVLHWRRAFLPHARGEMPTASSSSGTLSRQQQTLPSVMLCAPCGTGKTLMSLTSWLWAGRSCFDHLTMEQLNDKHFWSEDEVLRIQQEPAVTYKAFFMVHTTALMAQAADSVAKYVPGVRIGILQQDALPNPDDYDIVIASTDTLAARDSFDTSYLDHFPIFISDEAHENKANFFFKAVRKVHSPYALYLTATPRSPLLPPTLGPVLAYLQVPVNMSCNMIAYGCGTRQGRTLKIKTISKAEKADKQGELADLVVDMRRNAWLVHFHMHSAIIGKNLDSHTTSLDANFMRRFVWDPFSTGKLAKLFSLTRVRHSSHAFSALDAKLASQAPALPTAKPIPRAQSNSSEFANAMQLLASMSNNMPTPSEIMATASTSTQTTDSYTNRLDYVQIDSLPSPFNPSLNKRCPIFFSESIAQLIMHQHWHAQYWIDSSTMPRENLMLVRIGVRQLAVIDVSRLTEAQKTQLRWLSPRAHRVKHGEGLNSSGKDWTIGPSAFEPDVCQHRFDAPFWKQWFDEWFINKTHATEAGKPFLTKPSSTYKPNKVVAKSTSFSKSSTDMNALFEMAGMDAEDVAKPNKQTSNATWQPVNFDYSDWMNHASYFWTPIALPLPKIAKKARVTAGAKKNAQNPPVGKGAWVPETYEEDHRNEWPIFATFGLYTGMGHAMPIIADVLPNCSRIHNADALQSDFCYATYQIASTGIDKAQLDQLTEGSTINDNVQCTGRCLRADDTKQRVLKNEMIEPIGCFKSRAFTHSEVLKNDKVKAQYFMICYE